MRTIPAAFFALCLLAPTPSPAAAQQAGDPVMSSMRPYYERVKDFLLRSAEAMSEEDLAHRPTPDVRTGLAMFTHVADAQHFFCSAALGEATPHETEIERTATTKAAMLTALRESFDYCDRAYAQTDAEALSMLAAFGANRPRLTQIVLNTAHNWEHYGNIVTYMRIRGLVPPSSQPRQ